MTATDDRRRTAAPVLSLDRLHVTFQTDGAPVHAVKGISFDVDPGEILAVVGESGSGKSVSSRAILGLLPDTATVTGSARLEDTDLLRLRGEALRRIRGEQVSMVFQEPSTALNPVYTVGWQIGEALRAHRRMSKKAALARAVELLDMVGIPEPERRVHAYPHQMSGGQKQRVVIAMAIAGEPKVIIADEPTTALDVTVQAAILELLRSLRDRLGTAIILITHNMGVVADLADRVVVMYRGEVVEEAPARTLFAQPQHPYTQRLLATVPHLGHAAPPPGTGHAGGAPPGGPEVTGGGRSVPGGPAVSVTSVAELTEAQAEAAPVLDIRNLVVEYPGRLGRPSFRAVDDVSLQIRAHEVLALVGESGSGKTTVGRTTVGLLRATAGTVRVLDHDITHASEHDLRPLRARFGFVFQDPAASLNPRMSIEACIAEPLIVHTDGTTSAIRSRVAELLDAVQLPTDYAARYPHELSGGQRQRVSLARAIALRPELLIADEPTSALDVSVQAKVLDLFRELQAEMGFACLFISHDLAVVDQLAHRVAVLKDARLVEVGTRDQVLRDPQDVYTQRLIAAVPVPDPVEQAERRRRRAELLRDI